MKHSDKCFQDIADIKKKKKTWPWIEKDRGKLYFLFDVVLYLCFKNYDKVV